VSTNAAVGKWMYIPSIDDARVTVRAGPTTRVVGGDP
jgi:hypothetical protein